MRLRLFRDFPFTIHFDFLTELAFLISLDLSCGKGIIISDLYIVGNAFLFLGVLGDGRCTDRMGSLGLAIFTRITARNLNDYAFCGSDEIFKSSLVSIPCTFFAM